MQPRRIMAYAPTPTPVAQRKPAAVPNQRAPQGNSLLILNRYLGNSYLQRNLAQPKRPLLSSSVGANLPQQVQTLQTLLNNHGAQLNVDGFFGPQTRAAVIQFQKANGLKPDGLVGPRTWGALEGGGSAGNGGNGQAEALIKAKLGEITAYMKQLNKSSPQNNQTVTGSAEPVELNSVHQHDSDEEEGSWWDEVKGAASDAYNSASNAVGSVAESAGEAWNDVKTGAQDIYGGAKEVWNDVKTGAGNVINDVASGLEAIPGQVGEIVSGVQQTVNQGIDDVVGGVSEFAQDVGEGLDEIAEDVKREFASEIAAVEEFINDIKHFIENPDDALRKLDEILNGLKKKAGELLGDEEDAETRTGTAAPVEMLGGLITCADRLPTRKLKISLGHDTEQREGAVSGDVINADSVHGSLAHKSNVTTGDTSIAAVPASDFGTTGSRIKVEPGKWTAKHFTDFVDVPMTVHHTISSDVTSATKQIDVPPDLSNIEETIIPMHVEGTFKWHEAADDLDPDVAKVGDGAPRRTNFWAKDITWSHEKFHAKDQEDYLKTTIMPALETDLNSRNIEVPWLFWRDSTVESQVHQIAVELAKKATAMVNAYMAKPAAEVRAYTNDEPAYRARAKAIRDKAKSNGWAGK